jgi:hypothetical protein
MMDQLLLLASSHGWKLGSIAKSSRSGTGRDSVQTIETDTNGAISLSSQNIAYPLLYP